MTKEAGTGRRPLGQILKEAGILVRYWASRPDLNSKLRITVGAQESNEKFIALTRKLLAELKK